MSLELYAKIEPLIGFYEEYDELHHIYIELLKNFGINTVLDVGCGNGSMLQKLSNSGYKSQGIDISSAMVDISRQKGLDVECKDISQVATKYDAIVAIGDVINYIKPDELRNFFEHISNALDQKGIFIADINTKYGFESVAQGCVIKDFDDKFLAIDATFDNNILTTDFIYFEKQNKEYAKQTSRVLQYFYTQKEIVSHTSLHLLDTIKVKMFSSTPDKSILIFQK